MKSLSFQIISQLILFSTAVAQVNGVSRDTHLAERRGIKNEKCSPDNYRYKNYLGSAFSFILRSTMQSLKMQSDAFFKVDTSTYLLQVLYSPRK